MIIHAVSIHSGGGKVLLDQLLQENTLGAVNILVCDSRYQLPENVSSKLAVYPIKATLKERLLAEYLLNDLSKQHPQLKVLCFSNLPPIFRLKGKTILYLQNALLLPGAPHVYQNFKTKLRFMYEKMWSKIFWNNLDEVWVQTNWMKEGISNRDVPVKVLPIVPTLPAYNPEVEKQYDFITVSGSAPHKKLLNLLQSWSRLKPPYPKLIVVTDTPSDEIASAITQVNGKNVTVKVNISRNEVLELYQQSESLIITSKIESYCLPIYEAMNFKLGIVAPDEAYAREACPDCRIINPDDPDFVSKLIRESFSIQT